MFFHLLKGCNIIKTNSKIPKLPIFAVMESAVVKNTYKWWTLLLFLKISQDQREELFLIKSNKTNHVLPHKGKNSTQYL